MEIDNFGENMAEELANEVLDGYGCNGKSLREWVFLILQLTGGEAPVDPINRIELRNKLNEYYERSSKTQKKTVLEVIEMLESMPSLLPRERS